MRVIGSGHIGPAIDSARVDGGRGDDFIAVTVVAVSESPATASAWVDGGSGNDEIVVHVDAIADFVATATATVHAGAGNDEIVVHVDAGAFIAAFATTATATVHAGAGNDIVRMAEQDVVNIGSADLVFGDSGHDTISGGAGNDSLFGGTGNDTLADGTGRDLISGDVGDDLINLLNDGTTDRVDLNRIGGLDVITGFDTDAPNSGAGEGDLLDINDLIAFAGGPNDLAGAVAGGFVTFVGLNANADTQVRIDANGGANSLVAVATMQGVAFTDVATATALLADNIVVA